MPRGIPNARPAEADPIETVGFGPFPIVQNVDPAIEAMKAELARQLEQTKELNAKLAMKAEVRAEVSQAISEQQMEQRRRDFGRMEPAKPEPMPPKPENERLITVKLDRHYRPRGYYEIVGYHKEAVFKKRPDGQVVEVEKAEFITGELKPPHIAGVGFASKVWAGTVLKLCESEARTVRAAGVGSIELD
jgi:hypothetical protein